MTFQVELLEKKRIRLVLSNKEGTMLACRKSTIKEVNDFLKGVERSLFKGRLQLVKNSNTLNVLFKETIATSLSYSNFSQLISDVNYPIGEIFKGMHCIWLPDSLVASFGKNKRVIATCGNHQWHCAFNRSKALGYYIYLNKKLLKALNKKTGDLVPVSFVVDKTENQFGLPEELEEVLATDLKAKKIFDSLTPGNKRGIIHLIAKIKSMDKRIEKSLLLTKRLKMGITSQKEIFKTENR